MLSTVAIRSGNRQNGIVPFHMGIVCCPKPTPKTLVKLGFKCVRGFIGDRKVRPTAPVQSNSIWRALSR